jgi:hypothetical protein
VCRRAQGGDAMLVLSADSTVSLELLGEIAEATDARLARVVDLDED